jgi:hypothetical protein
MANSGCNFDAEGFRRNSFSYFLDSGKVTALEQFSILLNVVDDPYGANFSNCLRQRLLLVDDYVLKNVGFLVRLCQSFDLCVPSGIELFRWVGIDFAEVERAGIKVPKWPRKNLSLRFDEEIALEEVSDFVLLLFGESAAKNFRSLAEFLRPNYNSLEDCIDDILKSRYRHHFSWGLPL